MGETVRAQNVIRLLSGGGREGGPFLFTVRVRFRNLLQSRTAGVSIGCENTAALRSCVLVSRRPYARNRAAESLLCAPALAGATGKCALGESEQPLARRLLANGVAGRVARSHELMSSPETGSFATWAARLAAAAAAAAAAS